MAKINWTDQANNDIDAIIDFLAPQSETYTKIQIKRIFQKIDLLENMPQLGRIVPELEYPSVREIIVGNFRIVYHLRNQDRIDILTVFFSASPIDFDKIKPAK